ncbi:hypothetical protein [Phyllobacterium sp. SB3]|uniref:hypothetical protein n=1 Tax=Phyllobacterium sp. SB3 TaxID=3156073 RepID=UPI0032AFDDDE
MFGFNIRSPERDRETDISRFRRIVTTLTAVKNELEKEKLGLNKRFAEASADAALTLEAMADIAHPESYETRVENLTSVIKAYEKRIVFLDGQINFVDGVLGKVSSFCDEF